MTGQQVSNAIVDGFRGAFETALGAAFLAAHVGPSLVLWALVLAVPLSIARRHLRRPAMSRP